MLCWNILSHYSGQLFELSSFREEIPGAEGKMGFLSRQEGYNDPGQGPVMLQTRNYPGLAIILRDRYGRRISHEHQPCPVLRRKGPAFRPGKIFQLCLLQRLVFIHSPPKDFCRKFHDQCARLFINFPKAGYHTVAAGIVESMRQRDHAFAILVTGFSGFAGGEHGE